MVASITDGLAQRRDGNAYPADLAQLVEAHQYPRCLISLMRPILTTVLTALDNAAHIYAECIEVS